MAHGELAWLFHEPDIGLDHCPIILLSCYGARTSAQARPSPAPVEWRSCSDIEWRTLTRNQICTPRISWSILAIFFLWSSISSDAAGNRSILQFYLGLVGPLFQSLHVCMYIFKWYYCMQLFPIVSHVYPLKGRKLWSTYLPLFHIFWKNPLIGCLTRPSLCYFKQENNIWR